MTPPLEGLLFVGGMDDARAEGAMRRLGMAVLKPVDALMFPRTELAVAVLDPDAFGVDAVKTIGRAAETLGDTPIVLLSGARERSELAQLVEIPSLVGIVARDHVSSDDELERTLRAVTAGLPPGLEPHLTGGEAGPEFARNVPSSQDRDDLLVALEAHLEARGVRARIVGIVVDACEELLTNALYDAPTDATGRHIYAEVDRRHAIFLTGGSRPELRAVVTPAEVVVSVRDPFGSLELGKVRRYLARGLGAYDEQLDDSKKGGAGLGLARVFAMVDRLAIRVRPEVETEVIFALATKGARRDMATRPTGLLLDRDAAGRS